MNEGQAKNYEVIQVGEGRGSIVKAWVKGVELAENARNQLINLAQMPFIHKWVAAMPDAHFGMGATVGSVIATKGAVIPAAVGVDLGCGMIAARTGWRAEDLPDGLAGLRSLIESRVPVGGPGVKGSWLEAGFDLPEMVVNTANNWLMGGWLKIVEKHSKVNGVMTSQLGTLGTGNHFIEVCLDETGQVWVMLHSGSRGVGNRIASYFIELAKKDMRRWFVNLPDQDLAYIPQGSEHFKDYMDAIDWAQRYAAANREVMLKIVVEAVNQVLSNGLVDRVPGLRDSTYQIDPEMYKLDIIANCHHNYIAWEHHYGDNVMVTRKGAVKAGLGDMGVIPGSMGARSYVVRGKGNPESFNSCSHGAGRVMSRGEARRSITVEQHRQATAGVECRKDAGVLDESPAAYKDIDAVMEAQKDLVEVVHTLKQVMCVKG